MDSTAYVLFRSIREELADGMKHVEYVSDSVGDHFRWKNLNSSGQNLTFLKNDINQEEVLPLHEWLHEEDSNYLLYKEENPDPSKLNFYLLKHNSINKRAPAIDDMNVRSFTFDNRDIRINYRQMTENLANFKSSDMSSKIEWERFIGGLLHMCKGKIWTLQTIDDQIIACVIFASVDGNDNWMIEGFGSNTKIDANGNYLSLLLENTLQNYDKDSCYAYAISSSIEFKTLSSLNFEIVDGFTMTNQI